MHHATDTRLSHSDLARLRRKLEHKREALLEKQREARPWARGISDGEIENADVAERMNEQRAVLAQDAIDRILVAEIEHALGKLEAGTYGFSEASGKAIDLDRLDAIPWARRTADEEPR